MIQIIFWSPVTLWEKEMGNENWHDKEVCTKVIIHSSCDVEQYFTICHSCQWKEKGLADKMQHIQLFSWSPSPNCFLSSAGKLNLLLTFSEAEGVKSN